MEIRVRGHRCVYDLVGQGPNLTLLHSVGLSTRHGWRYQIGALAERFRVLTFDFRGFGESERGSEHLSVPTLVEDLSALLRMLGISNTALMGVSLGGFVAQAFAIAHPETVAAMVLVSTANRIVSAAAPRRVARNAQIRQYGMSAAAGHQLESHFPPDFAAENPEIMDWYESHYLANDPDNYMEIMDDLGAFDSTDCLARVSCPALIVAGGSDVTSVAGNGPLDSARTLHRLIAQSELAVIEGAHHYPQIDHAGTFNRRVIEFLSRIMANSHQTRP